MTTVTIILDRKSAAQKLSVNKVLDLRTLKLELKAPLGLLLEREIERLEQLLDEKEKIFKGPVKLP